MNYFKILPIGLALRLYILQVTRKILLPYLKLDFSYSGETSILNDFFGYRTKGFYVDVGCNHPIKTSNTFSLYLKGWNGIAIDASQELTNKFRSVRKKDIVVHAAISDSTREINYYDFGSSHLLNTINDDVGVATKENHKVKGIVKMETRTLTEILETSGITPGYEIDLLSVDVEGHDLQVLRSLDFKKYTPHLIMVECHGFNLEDFKTNGVYMLLSQNGYRLIGYISMNAYFLRTEMN